MLRVISLNLNGIRSAAAKGYLAWLVRQKPDCVCMQEIKAQQNDLPEAILMPGRQKGYFDFAHKKGYSGVGMYCVTIPRRVYSNDQMKAVADGIARLYERRDRIKGLRFVYEPPALRFFQGRFEPLG